MDIAASSSVAAAVSAASAGDAAGITTLRKALDVQQQTAAQLIQSLPQPQQASPGDRIGSNINVMA